MFLVYPCSCLHSIHWGQVLSWEWKCSWSSADRRCSNYIWVINNFIAYWDATYIRGFRVVNIFENLAGVIYIHDAKVLVNFPLEKIQIRNSWCASTNMWCQSRHSSHENTWWDFHTSRTTVAISSLFDESDINWETPSSAILNLLHW